MWASIRHGGMKAGTHTGVSPDFASRVAGFTQSEDSRLDPARLHYSLSVAQVDVLAL
jgi:hypothetical protein